MSSADTFHTIADAHRRQLIDLLRDGERPVSWLVAGTGISYSAVSQHLNILRRAGLVSRRASGTQRFYRLNAAPLEEVYDWCAQYRLFWRARLKHLREYLDKHQ
jgi:DNA-binding transcriptional ArsR family regulator